MIDAPGPKGTFAEWLAYIESIHPASIDMGLTRVQSIGVALGLLTHWSCPIVTVAGTNGKGTTVKTLASALMALDYSVGAYSSPHLIHFAERIELNLHPVSNAELIDAFCIVEEARVLLGETLSYFEFTTLAALWIFKHKPLDVLILEVGLGGRLDAVNIIDSDVSVITNIGWDHMEYLGDTLDKIATEKAGIIRANKPVIVGQGAYRAIILALAKAKQAKLYVRGRDFEDVILQGKGQQLNQLFPDSVQLAIQALKLIAPNIGLLPEKLQNLFNDFPLISVQGRFQQLTLGQVEWVIDVAHNVHAANWLVENLNQLPQANTTYIVWCSFADKDLEGILGTILEKLSPKIKQTSAWVMGPLDHIRSATQQKLNLLSQHNLANQSEVFERFEQALKQAYNQAKPNDRVVVFGSFQASNEAFAFIKKAEGLNGA
jgi:dihydrofolate synthase/folylpolyglutamate synthase